MGKSTRFWGVGLVLLQLATSFYARASEPKGVNRFLGKREQPFHVQADKLSADNQKGIVTFTGGVMIRQADMILEADKIEVHFDPASREAIHMLAEGRVRVSQKDLIATAEKAFYDTVAEVITLTGSPRLWQKEDQISGNKIIFQLEQDSFTVESARARVSPQRLKELSEKEKHPNP